MLIERLKDLRQDKDLFQKDIAKYLSITERKYSYIETGQSDIEPEILIELAEFYHTSVDYILRAYK